MSKIRSRSLIRVVLRIGIMVPGQPRIIWYNTDNPVVADSSSWDRLPACHGSVKVRFLVGR